MAKLFIRPSQVVDRLRETFTTVKAKYPTFPDIKVKAVADNRVQDEIADSDATDSKSITLYVSSGLSTGQLITDAALAPTKITHGISIGLVVGTNDEQSQYADELQNLIKEFVVLSLHGWIFNDGYTPLYFATEFLFQVRGRAIYFRTYEFQHQVDVTYTDLDDLFDYFDSLDDFTQLYSNVEAITPPEGDTAEYDVNVEIPPSP